MGLMTEWVTVIDDATFERLVVVSPHFDDAVLGCGQLLAKHGGNVVTVMGGARRDGYDTVTSWDELGGFQPGQDVVAARRAEDEAALTVLGATSSYLEFTDNQYDLPTPAADRPPAAEVAAALEARLVELAPSAVFIPFGLANPDHVVTHDAARLVVDRRPSDWQWFGYAEAGYSHIPGVVAWRVGKLLKTGLWPTPAPIVADGYAEQKAKAMACYASQIPPLQADWGYDASTSTRVNESYWRLAPPPDGWGRMAE
jgi:LmbE family N-acetylglucosaminyl deacetylase